MSHHSSADVQEAAALLPKFSRTMQLAALALAASMSAAEAQTANAGAQSGSNAGAQAGSQSGSTAAIQQTFQGPPASTRQEFIYGGGTNSTGQFTNRVEGTQTLRNVPQVYAPALGGTNPCAQGASAGGAVAGFGITLGGQWSDQDCERRNAAALLHNTGQPAIAQEVLCGSDSVREARRRLAALGQGALCAQDILDQQAAAARAAASRPVGSAPAPLVTPAPVVATPISAPASTRTERPAWCDTASPAELRAYRTACAR